MSQLFFWGTIVNWGDGVRDESAQDIIPVRSEDKSSSWGEVWFGYADEELGNKILRLESVG